MTPQQFEIFLERNDKSTREAIETHVNGKIRNLDQKLTDHITDERAFREEVKPYLQGAAGLKVVRNFFIWVAGFLVAYAAIKNFKL